VELTPSADSIRRLAAAGPGWHLFALDAAQELAKKEPEQAGLVADVKALIGPAALPGVEDELKKFMRADGGKFTIPPNYRMPLGGWPK
jgi:hypothetical protein